MWRPRDRERYVGGYDPEHEMPDPDRDPGDRWQSGSYRHNARDTRFAYRMNPDAFEHRFDEDRGGYYNRGGNQDRDARDMNRDYDRGNYDRGSYDRGTYGGGYRGSGSDYDRGNYNRVDGGYFDRVNRFSGGGSDRGGWDRDRDYGRGGSEYGRGERDYGWSGGGDRGGYGGGYGGGYRTDYDRGRDLSGPHFDRFSADRGRDHDRWNSRDRGGYDDFWQDDWRRRR